MYTRYYELREEPFRLTPDPRFLHLAEPHEIALAALVDAVVRRKGFMVVTGPVGTGKTTLLHVALQILSKNAFDHRPISSAFVLNPTLNRDELFELLLDEFEISSTSPSKAARLASLHRMFLQVQRRGGTSVLIVDEAHLMTLELLEEIRLLSNMETYNEKLLQIILCGQPELRPMLVRPELSALRQRITHICTLRPLSLSETRAYIAERLHTAGLRGASPFAAVSVDLIYRFAQGVPRLINQISDCCLVIGCREQQKVILPDVVEEAAAQLGLFAGRSAETVQDDSTPTVFKDIAPKSTVDLLIEAMKQRRATARE